MCGRYALTLPDDAMARLFRAQPSNRLPKLPNYNICPSDQVHVVMQEAGGRRLRPMRWGFLPSWYQTPTAGPLLINARAETLADKPAFRAACRQRRCLIPASGFYEWERRAETRLPWYVLRRDGAPMALGGIWQDWGRDDPQPTCAIVTTAANPVLAPIHHRMPLLLEPEDWPLWLGEAGHGAARLMRPAAEEILVRHRVGTEINSNRAEGPGLIEELIEPFDPE
ncbi:SOS response-associated peptidase [Pseudodonghicola flavimaris]|uniref:Abasic site processing protein n=1 Tax=Pseudodonghicola flavimaris TaxID=3050036 RepID=A0ABT7F4I1_9RHOB|nr:SOS response-associated peptidase [Pseudodonghicola flavimaris]MDK3019516.1 SOS response-associated peptidase [Pseudodonghicola flavimaris]